MQFQEVSYPNKEYNLYFTIHLLNDIGLGEVNRCNTLHYICHYLQHILIPFNRKQ